MFPMYRGKRQSKVHKTLNRLVLGPRRRRRELVPNEGEANAENMSPVLLNAEQLMDDDDSYEAPVAPSKPSSIVKKTSEHQVVGENKEVEEKLDANVEKKAEVQKETTENFLNPPAMPAVVQQPQEYASNEYLQNPFCNNFILPLTRTKVDGVNYYNMSVS